MQKVQTWTPLEGKPSAWLFSNVAQCVSTACGCQSLSLNTQHNYKHHQKVVEKQQENLKNICRNKAIKAAQINILTS